MACVCGHCVEEHPRRSACDECECVGYEEDDAPDPYQTYCDDKKGEG